MCRLLQSFGFSIPAIAFAVALALSVPKPAPLLLSTRITIGGPCTRILSFAEQAICPPFLVSGAMRLFTFCFVFPTTAPTVQLLSRTVVSELPADGTHNFPQDPFVHVLLVTNFAFGHSGVLEEMGQSSLMKKHSDQRWTGRNKISFYSTRKFVRSFLYRFSVFSWNCLRKCLLFRAEANMTNFYLVIVADD